MRVQLNDFEMAYDENGSQTPLVLIHGYPLNRQIWTHQLRQLADVARVLAIDLRGHGESSSTPAPYSIDLLADDIKQFLDALNITQPIVLGGLSMGGYVVFSFLRKYPERLAGLILTATRSGPDSAEAKANRDKAADMARREGVPAIAKGMLTKLMAPRTYEEQPGLVERVGGIMEQTSLNGVLGDLAAMKERPDSTPLLSSIGLPVKIIHGAEDQLIPSLEARGMQEAIPNASLELIAGAGHLPCLEQPEAFSKAVRAFMATL